MSRNRTISAEEARQYVALASAATQLPRTIRERPMQRAAEQRAGEASAIAWGGEVVRKTRTGRRRALLAIDWHLVLFGLVLVIIAAGVMR